VSLVGRQGLNFQLLLPARLAVFEVRVENDLWMIRRRITTGHLAVRPYHDVPTFEADESISRRLPVDRADCVSRIEAIDAGLWIPSGIRLSSLQGLDELSSIASRGDRACLQNFPAVEKLSAVRDRLTRITVAVQAVEDEFSGFEAFEKLGQWGYGSGLT